MGTYASSENREELIRQKAYEFYVKRGCEPGFELDDWLNAEKIVAQEFKPPTAGKTPAEASAASSPTSSKPVFSTASSAPTAKTGAGTGFKRYSR